MFFSTLFLTLSLSLGTRADGFVVWSDDEAKKFGGSNPACVKALSARIECPIDLTWLWNNSWRGPTLGRELDSNGKMTEGICRKGCAEQLQDWYGAVDKHCKWSFRQRGDMLQGQKLFCDRDPKTGKYCHKIIDEIYEDDYFSKDRDMKNKYEFPRKYLCVPCYARRVYMMDLNRYNPSNNYWKNQRQRIKAECPESILEQISVTATVTAPAYTEDASTSTTEESTSTWTDPWTKVSTRTTVLATATPELSPESPEKATQEFGQESKQESTTSSESNAAEKLGQGQLNGYCLCLSANAFTPYDENPKYGAACSKAISSDIDCDRHILRFQERWWQGSLDDDELTESLCSDTCSKSIEGWFAAFEKDCKKDDFGNGIGNMYRGWKQICDKDEKTGKYCNEIIDAFPELNDDEKMAVKDLCHPCYAKRIFMLPLTDYNLGYKYYEGQRKRIQKECPKSLLAEIPELAGAEEAPKAEEPASVATKSLTKTEGGEETTVAPVTTGSLTAAASSEASTSSENAAERLGRGQLCGYWYWSLFSLVMYL
ncbi:hypothetical protein F53441_13067 [Fusarium austroafricanum]|uniref:Uncharacterized protein n=1 Tax=Fusarium austroafricanum TaxID=2364996 RepID=A0A8H4JS97_9HYPO|nr:hypothetical protein F53441_13067 [Fusarium austroafricanum]